MNEDNKRYGIQKDIQLNPIILNDVINNGEKTLKIKNGTLVFHPFFDEEKQCFWIKDEHLGIMVFSEDRDSLFHYLIEDIFFLWKHYAKENDENMTADAQQLAQNIRNTFKEI